MNFKSFFKVSTGHEIIENPNKKELKKQFEKAWTDPKIPPKQLRITQTQSEDYMANPAISVLVKMIKSVAKKGDSVLEVGCSSGYHADVFKQQKIPIKYEGCDYSPSFIKLARDLHPGIDFRVSDATKLSYKNKSFDVLISGSCILHIIDYEKAIKEAVRVSKKYVVFHRTPVLHLTKTTFVQKYGYGVKMLEVLFNESELISLFRKYGLVIKDIQSYHTFTVDGLKDTVYMKNYFCEKCSS